MGTAVELGRRHGSDHRFYNASRACRWYHHQHHHGLPKREVGPHCSPGEGGRVAIAIAGEDASPAPRRGARVRKGGGGRDREARRRRQRLGRRCERERERERGWEGRSPEGDAARERRVIGGDHAVDGGGRLLIDLDRSVFTRRWDRRILGGGIDLNRSILHRRSELMNEKMRETIC